MKSTATASWTGGLKDGKGTLTADGGAFKDTPYSFAKRFEGAPGPGTTPEELIAAAHAGCYAMAFSGALGGAGFTVQRITARATVTLDRVDGKATVTESHLEVRASVPGIDAAKFAALATETKTGCPISRLLNTNVTLDAKLEG
ncbi:MAG TPA: OsmC family protein [Candidatus Acidoferrales bacterium]|nr:OsmC family protein [Candidatus Acidoferrales bacterium]